MSPAVASSVTANALIKPEYVLLLGITVTVVGLVKFIRLKNETFPAFLFNATYRFVVVIAAKSGLYRSDCMPVGSIHVAQAADTIPLLFALILAIFVFPYAVGGFDRNTYSLLDAMVRE